MSEKDPRPSRFARRAVPNHPCVYWFTKNGAKPTPPYQAITYNGEGRQLSKSGFSTVADAEAWLAELTTLRRKGVVVKTKTPTVREWGETWLVNHAELNAGSERLNRQRLHDYVYPVIGNRRVGGTNPITKHDILAVKRAMEAPPLPSSTSRRKKEKLSQNTIKGVLAMLGAMFQAAVDEDMIAFNPAKQLSKQQRKAKATRQRRMVILKADEIPKLISKADEVAEYFGPLVYTALFTGMRQNELRGLQWRDVHIHHGDRAKPYIVVRGQLERRVDPETGDVTFGQRELKSKDVHFTRQVSIPKQLADRLRAWRAASPRSGPDDFVFVSAVGTPASDSTIRANFYRSRDRAGIDPGMCFHHLRDTHASMLIAKGRPITEIAARLGHTKGDGSPNPATTLKHYAHLFDHVASQDSTRDVLEELAVGL